MSTKYGVVVEKFAERHFISGFKKKYKSAWDVTWKGIEEELRRIDALIGVGNMVEIIMDRGEIKICKTEFRVASTQQSRHGSGNRCIIAVHQLDACVRVLLVYHKNDLRGGTHETAAWKNLVREHYAEYAEFCK